jgi:conjugal transfer pilus assembly protein TraB
MKQILESGAGSGVGQAGKDLSKFYLDLAKQTIPVVEVKATRHVTLVLTEGVDLKIKDVCTGNGGAKCEDL